MTNLGHHIHALCLIPIVMSEGLCLSTSIQRLPSLRDMFLVWFVDQFDQRPSPYLPDSFPLHSRFSIEDFLPRRRFGSGAFPCRRWFFRFSTGDCLLTQRYEVFIWVFDPGINRALVADEDLFNLVATKTSCQAQWVTAGALVLLFVVVEDENYVPDLSVLNRQTEMSITLIWMIQGEASYMLTDKLLLGLRLKGLFAQLEFTQVCLVAFIIGGTIIQMVRRLLAVFANDVSSYGVMFSSPESGYIDRDQIDCMMAFWLYQFGFLWFELSNLPVGLVICWRRGFHGIDQIGRSETVLATLRWVLFDMRGSGILEVMVNFLVVMFKRITQAQYFKETVVRKCWCHYASIPELALDTSALMLRFVKRSHSQLLLYTIRNKEESNMKLDNNRFFDRLASKATLRKASSNSLLLYFLLVYGTYICVCNNCIPLILYVFVIPFSD